MSKNAALETHRLQATFLTSAPDLRRCPEGSEPEIAFAGRSNAGKSSVLNRLTGNRRTAKVSKTPGRTQLLNFFAVAGGGRIVDLPGYGYAKAAKSEQQKWQAAVNHYLSHRENLAGVVLIMDIRHPLQPFDVDLLAWSTPSQIPVHVLLNKADKLKANGRQRALAQTRKALKAHPLASLQLFSALSGLGQPELLQHVQSLLQAEAGTTKLADPRN